MRNITLFYEEYRNNMRLACENDKTLVAESGKNMLDAARALSKLAHLGRLEGLLALEDESDRHEVSELPLSNELKRMLGFVVNGTDSDILEKTALNRYYSREYQGVDALLYLIYLDTCLEIQAGLLPDLIDEELKALLPENLENDFDVFLNDQNQSLHSHEKSDWEDLFSRSDYSDVSGKVSDDIRLIDKCIVSMSNADMQRLIKEVGKDNIAVYMKIMDGDAVRKLYDNLPRQKRDELYEYSQSFGPMELADIEKTAEVILKIIRRLEDEGEIHIVEGM